MAITDSASAERALGTRDMLELEGMAVPMIGFGFYCDSDDTRAHVTCLTSTLRINNVFFFLASMHCITDNYLRPRSAPYEQESIHWP